MNDLETVLVLSTALTQFIENATDDDEPDEDEARSVALAQGLLDQFDAILANLGNPTEQA
jgi:hypothetical protein